MLSTLVVVSALLWGAFVWARNYHLRSFRPVADQQLYRSGQLSHAGLQYVCWIYAIKTVVTLRAASDSDDPQSDDWETTQCSEHGIQHIRLLPHEWKIDETGEITAQKTVKEFLEIMDNPANHPVLIHCFAGHHRTGILCAIYRMEYDHWTAADAIQEMERLGFPPGPNREPIEKYLSAYRTRN